MVERVEPEANKVTITRDEELEGTSQPEPALKPVPKAERDRPNTAPLVKKVRLREAGICGNPGCRRRGICHVHHLEYRVNGGKTVLPNTLLLCEFCRSAVHLGLLKIEGNPFTGLVFRRKTIPTLADFQLELKDLSSLPEIRLLEVRSGIDSVGRNGTSRRHSAIAESAVADSAIASATGSADEDLIKALMKIGYSRKEALKRLQLAREKLSAAGGKHPGDEELLAAAIRS